jgi:quinol monooxygenase YgiN
VENIIKLEAFAIFKAKGGQKTLKWTITYFVLVAVLTISISCNIAVAQEKRQIVHLAKLVIDPLKLEDYKSLLKEEIETSVHNEPGVLKLFAVAEKDNPTHITILEIYRDIGAYKSHLQSSHFLKYKTGAKNMVKSLVLIEEEPLLPGLEIK